MKSTRASQMALETGAFRTLESANPATQRLCDDPYARQFIPAWSYLQFKLFARFGEQRKPRRDLVGRGGPG